MRLRSLLALLLIAACAEKDPVGAPAAGRLVHRPLAGDRRAAGGPAGWQPARHGYQLASTIRRAPRSATYRFALDFVAESGGWKVSKAQWERER